MQLAYVEAVRDLVIFDLEQELVGYVFDVFQ